MMNLQSHFAQSHTDEDMAVTAVILVALISNNIHAEVIQAVMRSHSFILNQTADFCLISKWTGDGKKLLWNSSEPLGSSMERNASYRISSLGVSDSGWYQEQCWTQGNMTHEKNSSLVVCDQEELSSKHLSPSIGQSLELTCDGAGPNQSVQWYTEKENSTTGNMELALIDSETWTGGEVNIQLVKSKSSLLVTGRKPFSDIAYFCLEKNHQTCHILSFVFVYVLPEVIHRSVGDSLEMNCSDTRENQTEVWKIKKSLFEEEESLSYILRFPSLMLHHTGYYSCDVNNESYYLLVCHEPDPPTLALFSEGENMTLKCGYGRPAPEMVWLIKSKRTGGRVQAHLSRALVWENYHIDFPEMNLVIRNISLEDSGEFRCVVVEDRQCVFSSKTVLMIGEAEADHHLVRSVLVSVVITVMCVTIVVIVARVWSIRRRELLPVPVEEVEMSDLSPV